MHHMCMCVYIAFMSDAAAVTQYNFTWNKIIFEKIILAVINKRKGKKGTSFKTRVSRLSLSLFSSEPSFCILLPMTNYVIKHVYTVQARTIRSFAECCEVVDFLPCSFFS